MMQQIKNLNPGTGTSDDPADSPCVSKEAQALVDEINLIQQSPKLQGTSKLKCFAHDWLGTKLSPESMNRKQLYGLLLQEQQITSDLRGILKRLQAKTERVLIEAKHQERQVYELAMLYSGKMINEVRKECEAEISKTRKLSVDITEENNEYLNLLSERASAEKWFAIYLSRYQSLKHIGLSEYLETKKHPAKGTAAEIKKLVQTDYRLALRKISEHEATIAEYESLFPSIHEHVEKVHESREEILEDGGRNWLSDHEYSSLSSTGRNQLILDRYHDGHRKSNWQIGRDYELFIGHVFKRKGYINIIQYGIEKKLEDLGIDIIATNPGTGKMAYIQCKHWRQSLMVRENTVTQLYAGALIHMLNNNQPVNLAEFHICTSTTASDLAKQCAGLLGVDIHENISLGEYPSIKCKHGSDEYGKTKIYHLPIDQMYDRTFISGKNDFYAHTCEEAERNGFRRAFRWVGE